MTSLSRVCVLIALLAPFTGQGSERAPSVFILATQESNVGSSNRSVPGLIQAALHQALSREFRCATFWTQEALRTELEKERKVQMSGAEGGLDPIRDRLHTTEFLVASTLGFVGGKAILTATLIHLKRKEPVVRLGFSADSARGSIPRLVEGFVEKVARWQLCPYEGTLDLTVVTRRDGVPREVNGTRNCNGADQAYVQTVKHSEEVETSWALKKRLRRWADGPVRYSEWAQIDAVEEDPCHPCKSGRKYPRTSGRATRVDGVLDTEWGTSTGALVDIGFQDEGTYVIAVANGSSMKGLRSEAVTTWAEGACDTSPRRTIRSPKVEFSIPLRTVPITGQKGTALDKTLRGSGETQLPAAEGETTVLRWKYDLERK